MLESLELLDFPEELLEVVSEPPLLHDFGAKNSTVLHSDYVLGAGDPLLESLPHHDSVDHIADPHQLTALSIS